MNSRLRVTLLFLATLSMLGLAGSVQAVTPVYVDDDYTSGSCGGHTWGVDAFNTIQGGVNAVSAGGIVYVYAGNYTEQVVIATAGITIQGAGIDVTDVNSPVNLAANFNTGSPNYPIVFVNGVTGVTVRDLTVDGLGRGNANYRFIGVAFWNGDGRVLGCKVQNICETPFNGDQHGVGVYAYNITGGPYAIEVGSSSFLVFQKNAMALNGDGLTANVHDCVVTGIGSTTITAQNGVQFGWGAAGTLSNCSISGIFYSGGGWASSGLLAYLSPGVTVSGTNTFADCQTAIYYQDAPGSVTGAAVSGKTIWGGEFYNDSGSLMTSLPPASSTDGLVRPQASPLEENSGNRPAGGGQTLSGMAVSITNSCFTGNHTTGSQGIDAYTDGGPLTVSCSNLTVHDWAYGLTSTSTGGVLTVSNSSIVGNTSAGYYNVTGGHAQVAEMNWWGAADGPGGSGGGGGHGDAIVGSGVGFSPWRTLGTSSTVCAFTPADNPVTPGDPATCISLDHPCVTVPVNIARSVSPPENMRGYSVTFQLSSALALCSGLGSVTEGTYLSSVGGTIYHVTSNGGFSYTVDCAIQGLPCGATASSGDLFDISLTNTTDNSAGTVSITRVVLRDCLNHPIAGSWGPPATVTIDRTAPVAVSGLAAAQVKSGNLHSTNATKVTLTFTAPIDAAAVEVYRAGYGQYPEYNDNGGAVPATPGAYPPGSPWVKTGVTASGQTDSSGMRDFYYYVAYAKDACGNWSPVSNKTTGTLDYFLGDVAPGSGDNQVTGLDVSELGTHYGITLAHVGDPLNYLDVGPTTDYSVDALPTTDDHVDFEDLMVFAMNYYQVSLRSPVVPGETPSLAWSVPSALPQTGGTFVARLSLQGNHSSVKGIHARVSFDRSRLEVAGIEEGAWLRSQGDQVFFKSLDETAGLTLDAAFIGGGQTLQGSGDVALVTFRMRTAAPMPQLTLADLRDRANHELGGVGVIPMSRPASSSTDLPARVELLGARPDPFQGSASIVFRLPQTMPVAIRIYDVAGRLVQVVQDGMMTAGEHAVAWNGRDASGHDAGPGIFFYCFRAGGEEQMHKLLRQR